MKLLWGGLWGLVCIGGLTICAARAGDEDASMAALKARVKALEDDKAAAKPAASWIDKFSFMGRVRTRYEMIVDKSAAVGQAQDRQRGRVAVNFGVGFKPTDEIKAVLGISTGGNDPVSTNQTFDTDFSRKAINLELGFISYTPGWAKGLELTAGKMNQPFATPGNNQLIWDHDLRPEGLNAKYTREIWKDPSDSLTVFGDFGMFVVQERAAAAETFLIGLQAGGAYEFTAAEMPMAVRAGLGLYDYTAVAGRTPANMGTQGGSAFGNTLVGGAYREDFNEAEIYAAYDIKIKAWEVELPLSAYVDAVINTAASDQKTGFQIGVIAGKIKDPGSWAARLNYRDLKKDAVFGQFCDSDFVGGGTNGRGIEMGYDYMFLPNTTASMTLFANTKNMTTTKDTYTRLQVDVQVRF